MSNRYIVTIWGRLNESHGWGTVDITHEFTSKRHAERFAMAISKRLPAEISSHTGAPLAWVMVYSLSVPSNRSYFGSGYCYRAIDPGGKVVKDHTIPEGFYGHQPPRRTELASQPVGMSSEAWSSDYHEGAMMGGDY